MRISKVVSPTYVDGPGKRVAVFAQGCTRHCPGCQNVALWDANGGYEVDAAALATELLGYDLPITISGGEPFDQVHELHRLVRAIKTACPDREIIVYTGYTFHELVSTLQADVLYVLGYVDILVDGPYLQHLDAPAMQYMGSANQRAIDLFATAQNTAGWTLCHGPVTLDWDTPELIVTDEGDLLGATPLADMFAALGNLADTRRCGQTD